MALELIGIEAVWNCCYQNSSEAVPETKNEMQSTLPKTEMMYPKNVGALVVTDFTEDK